MSELNRELIAKAFIILGDKKFKYTILMTSNAYSMGINNLYIIFVIK